jgi:hypothetical protein
LLFEISHVNAIFRGKEFAMLTTALLIPVGTRLACGIGGLFEEWFNDIKFPQKTSMPMVVLFRDNGCTDIFFVYLLLEVEYYEYGGNC